MIINLDNFSRKHFVGLKNFYGEGVVSKHPTEITITHGEYNTLNHKYCRNLCFVTYKREDVFNVFEGGDDKEIMEMLDKLYQDKQSLKPVMLLTTWRNNTRVMRRLLELGADPACQDNEGRTCLHLAANNDSVEAVQILISHKVKQFFKVSLQK